MKTIHFYIHNAFPEGMAAARRQLCYAKGLLAEGNVVDVNVCHKLDDVDRGLPSVGNVEGVPSRYISGRVKHKNKLLCLKVQFLVILVRKCSRTMKRTFLKPSRYML